MAAANIAAMSNRTEELRDRVALHVASIWGSDVRATLPAELIAAIGIDRPHGDDSPSPTRWDERDVMLITYGDSVIGEGDPLAELGALFSDQLGEAFGMIHILPFFPYSSDRGFAVIDHSTVDPALGSWGDIDALSEQVDLMVDLVLNHVSTESAWFAQLLDDAEPGRRFIRTVSTTEDLSSVVRPRSLPLTHEFATAVDTQTVWTTFSADQADLDWAEPDLALEMLRIVDQYLSTLR